MRLGELEQTYASSNQQQSAGKNKLKKKMDGCAHEGLK